VRAPGRLGAVLLASSAAAIVLADRRRLRRSRLGLERLRDEIAAMGPAAPGRRVTVPDASETLRGLAAAINGMLSELDRRAASERRRTADALHTLRGPLAVMRTELDVSLRDEGLAPAAREVLVSAREEVDAMTRAVDNLLILTAMDEGRIELRVAPVALLDAVDAAARPFRRLAVARRLTLETGGEAVGGPGIGPKERARVFERFYRGDGDGGGGSGLGLAICREIAAAHGGSMRLKSEPSHGSAFTLALPARARPIA
jgi:signal transduction histidine kinase